MSDNGDTTAESLPGQIKADGSFSAWYTEPEAVRLLGRYGIDYPPHEVAETVEGAVLAAGRLGYPVVLKVISRQIVHKSDAGGVVTDVRDEEALRRDCAKMLRQVQKVAAGADVDGVLVAQQAPEGPELIVGGRRDPIFGPVVAAGVGGTLVELLKEVALRLAPLTATDAKEMLDETRAANLLAGVRGSPELDRVAVERLLLNVSDLLVNEPSVAEMDLNPVRVFARGCLALDVRVRTIRACRE